MKNKALIIVIMLSLYSRVNTASTPFKIEQWQTAKHTQVVFYQTTDVPMLNVNIAFSAGSAFDNNQFGLSVLTTRMLNQGSGPLSANDTAEHFADVGAQFQSETTRDMAVLQLKTLTETSALDKALATFALIVSQPRFEPEIFYHEKNQQLLTIAQSQASPDDIATTAFFEKLYQNHPYAHPINGTKASIAHLTIQDVQKFYRQYFVASNATIVLVGDITQDKAHQIAAQLTERLAQGQPSAPIAKAMALAAKETIAINYPSSQTMLRLGQLGIDHQAPDYFPLMIGNYILGGGALVSRLSQEVREKRGLSYGVVSQFMPMPGDGPFMISLSTENKAALTAIKITEKTLSQFLISGPSDEELIAAKQYLTGSFPLSLASNDNIANMLLRMAFYHLPKDYLETYTSRIASVSLNDIKRAFDDQIHPNKMLLVTVGHQTIAQ